MKGKKKAAVMFWLAVVCMFIFSASFLLMPKANTMAFEENHILIRIAGMMIWCPTIIATILLVVMNSIRRKNFLKSDIKGMGIIRVFSNIPASIADIAFCLSLIALIINVIVNPAGYSVFVLICLTVLTFLMHCMFNGVNFRTIYNSDADRKADKRVNNKANKNSADNSEE